MVLRGKKNSADILNLIIIIIATVIMNKCLFGFSIKNVS